MENKTSTALITGASSGIGLELARCFARDGHNLIMVAHYRGKLQEAAEKLHKEFPGIRVETIALDLSKDHAPEKLYKEVQHRGLQVDFLVNNAGFGEYGPFYKSDLQKELAMIHLNVIAHVHLTKLYLPEMISRNAGKILQVGSVASFMPAPLQSVYGATKAFVLSFGEALQEELKGTKVTVSLLFPPATDTNFFNVAGAQDTVLANGNLATAKEVAESGYKGFMKGQARIVPTLKGKIEVIQSNILPDAALAKAMKKQSEEIKSKKTATKKAATTEAPATTSSETETPKKRTTKTAKAKTTETATPVTETAPNKKGAKKTT
ncbi:SDR family NAD(P)-dependent oxidoreductase [Adhaeribacter aquaticus]|uniref:SDR family NAD(P)-dependent oxidoreductase n=1 Tax=Adhaeribacter aquaticus TaxID=299567 RepID=UPI00040B532B|nr:SDR family oxidoreductase [Adhaeribacter aquaticus]